MKQLWRSIQNTKGTCKLYEKKLISKWQKNKKNTKNKHSIKNKTHTKNEEKETPTPPKLIVILCAPEVRAYPKLYLLHK